MDVMPFNTSPKHFVMPTSLESTDRVHASKYHRYDSAEFQCNARWRQPLKRHRFLSLSMDFFFVLFFSCLYWIREIAVKLLTWHSYRPASRAWTYLICNVHVLEPGVCNIANRSSFVYICAPDDSMCQSLRRIHDIWFYATRLFKETF